VALLVSLFNVKWSFSAPGKDFFFDGVLVDIVLFNQKERNNKNKHLN
jgi:hypothetical protein